MGLVARAEASTVSLRSYSFSVGTGASAFSRSPTKSSSSATVSQPLTVVARSAERPNCSPISTCSRTVIDANGRAIWNVRAMPRRNDLVRGQPPHLFAFRSTSPDPGWNPVITLRHVVFPHPLGPAMPRILRPQLETRSLTAVELTESLGDPMEVRTFTSSATEARCRAGGLNSCPSRSSGSDPSAAAWL